MKYGKPREETLNLLRTELKQIKPLKYGFDIRKWIRITLKCSQATAENYYQDLKDYGDLS